MPIILMIVLYSLFSFFETTVLSSLRGTCLDIYDREFTITGYKGL